MIKIIPWADRKITKKSLAKIWNLFPNDEICMTELPKEYGKMQWAKVVARYYVLRGKDFSIEIDPLKDMNVVEELIKIGVKKFYFLWSGIREGLFFSSLDTISYSVWIKENYPDVNINIIYFIDYSNIFSPPNMDLVETSISFLSNAIKEKGINGIVRYPHPWYGKQREKRIKDIEKMALKCGNLKMENRCGCLTITPNTNIYFCPFCSRKIRKKLFGNADRDKSVCGTIDRGIFRNEECIMCNTRG